MKSMLKPEKAIEDVTCGSDGSHFPGSPKERADVDTGR